MEKRLNINQNKMVFCRVFFIDYIYFLVPKYDRNGYPNFRRVGKNPILKQTHAYEFDFYLETLLQCQGVHFFINSNFQK